MVLYPSHRQVIIRMVAVTVFQYKIYIFLFPFEVLLDLKFFFS